MRANIVTNDLARLISHSCRTCSDRPNRRTQNNLARLISHSCHTWSDRPNRRTQNNLPRLISHSCHTWSDRPNRRTQIKLLYKANTLLKSTLNNLQYARRLLYKAKTQLRTKNNMRAVFAASVLSRSQHW